MEWKKRSVQSETEGMAERLSIGLWGKDELLLPRTNVITQQASKSFVGWRKGINIAFSFSGHDHMKGVSDQASCPHFQPL